MRRFLLLAFLIILALVLLLAGVGYGLARGQPFHPGQAPYSLQHLAEFSLIHLLPSPIQRASYALDLLTRRTTDLVSLVGTTREAAGLLAVHEALDQAIQAVYQSPSTGLTDLKTRLANQLPGIIQALAALKTAPNDQPDLFKAIQARVIALEKMVGSFATPSPPDNPVGSAQPGNQAQPTPDSSPQGSVASAIAPVAVTFPPGSSGALHQFLPLSGVHAQLVCAKCHTNGIYKGTPTQCSVCHQNIRPVDHFIGECDACHNTIAWKPANFNHLAASATDCQVCHARQRPANHYTGQCSACHASTAWLPAHFNHQTVGAIDCQSCHGMKRPANHFTGQCSACHATTAWLPAHFNHQAAGATDCQSCHGIKRPANHFTGQCSACHATTAWLPAHFNHQAAGASDCQSCHAGKRPANHFTGQCSLCHSTNAWLPASFNHTGLADCQSCHTPPANHWSGQCSKCHTPGNWSKISVSGHTFPTNHGNAGGICSSCHDGTNASANCYKCHNQAETEKNHADKGISNIAGRCLQCHPTGKGGG